MSGSNIADIGALGATDSSSSELPPLSGVTAFRKGVVASSRSIYAYVLIGTYLGYGALAHDLHFSLAWTVISSIVVWAGPAQVILVSTLGSGLGIIQAAIAVGLSGIRLLPIVTSLLPLLRTKHTRFYHLLVTAHVTAVALWVESARLLPGVARENRNVYCCGFGIGLATFTTPATVLGYYFAAELPPTFAAAVLFITPLSFLLSTANNSRSLVDRVALGAGLFLAPLMALTKIELHLLAAGLTAGTIAYAVDRFRRIPR